MEPHALHTILGGVAAAVILFCIALYFILKSDYSPRVMIHQRSSPPVDENGEPIDTGVLSSEAGFKGLLIKERAKIMEEWLVKTTVPYNGSCCTSCTAADIETGDEEDLMCSICFEAYEEGDSVFTGTRCNHMFHSECAKAWLAVANHDQCPYCRMGIMQPNEFLEAASQSLGEKRVAELCQEVSTTQDEKDVESQNAATEDEEGGSSASVDSF